VTGAGSVMAYIGGISRLYVGQYAAGAALLAAMAVLAYAFWRGFDSYINELLSPEERAAMEEAERQPVDTVHVFGLAGLTAVIAFTVAIVLGVNAVVFTSGSAAWANLVAAMAAIGVGLWLRRKHKPGVATE
jgi:TRAP-type C4-dicarboxylate transport system permease large subunit